MREKEGNKIKEILKLKYLHLQPQKEVLMVIK